MQFRTEVDWVNEIPRPTLTLSHSPLLASALLKTASERLGSISPLHLLPTHLSPSWHFNILSF